MYNVAAVFQGPVGRDVAAAGLLTCALASQQVLALRLVGVDGCDGDGVFSVGVQVLQNVGGLIAIQDGLWTDTGGEGECEQCNLLQ